MILLLKILLVAASLPLLGMVMGLLGALIYWAVMATVQHIFERNM